MLNNDEWKTAHYAFFQNRECEYFPCHEVEDTENFNCLFCYCPLYALGRECGGGYVYLKNGSKDCTSCSTPHLRDNYPTMIEKCTLLCEKVNEEI